MRQNNRHLSYSDIVSITGNFQKMIGKGGFGKVYSGRLSDGSQVAVKMLSSPSTQGFKQCWTEASFQYIYIYIYIYIYTWIRCTNVPSFACMSCFAHKLVSGPKILLTFTSIA